MWQTLRVANAFARWQHNASIKALSGQAFKHSLGGAVAVWVASRPEACRLSQLQGCGFESAPLTSIA